MGRGLVLAVALGLVHAGLVVAVPPTAAGGGLVAAEPAAAAGAGLSDPLPTTWAEIGPTVDGRPVHSPATLAGRVTAVAVVPGSPPIEVIGTLGGIWRRSAAGAWVDVTSPSWPSTAISSLAVDPANPQLLYAGTGAPDATSQPGAGVLASTDGGTTWQPLAASQPLMRGYAVRGLAVDPLDHRIVVAAAQDGVFRSPDSGVTWSRVVQVTPGPFGVAEVRLAVDPVTGIMLAGVAQSSGITASMGSGTVTTGHALYRSTDGGLTWSAFAVDPGTGAGNVVETGIATLSATTYAYALDVTGDGATGLYTSVDGGQTWTLGSTALVTTKADIAQVAVDPVAPTTAYFAQEDGPFSYTWGSTTSTKVTSGDGTSPQFGDWRALGIGPGSGSGRVLYGGTDGGPCQFDLTARSFTNTSAGLVSGIDFFGAAGSATSELSGAQDLGVDAYRGGSPSEVYAADAYGVLIDRNNPSTYYAAVAGSFVGYVVSRDAGVTWHAVSLSPPVSQPYYLRPVQAGGDPSVLVLPDEGGALNVSTDDGATWVTRTMAGLGGDYLTIVRAAVVPGTTVPVMYAGTGFGNLWRSADLGATWTQLGVSFPLSVRDVLIDVGGSTGPAGEHVDVALGTYAPVAYATTSVAGDVQRTTDSGATWTDIGQGLSSTSVNVLMLSGTTLLAGTDRGVVRQSGGTWSPAGTGFPTVRVNDLFLSADGSAFFATTWGRGTLVSVLSVPPTISSFSPASANTGKTVTITGTGFGTGAVVRFGNLQAPKVTVVSATTLKAIVPNGAVAAPISVTTGQGTATSTTNFTPLLSITGLSPGHGPIGTVVTISGIGFNPGSKVIFNQTAATGVTYISSTELQAAVPTSATTGPVKVTNSTAPTGTVRSAGKFTVG